MRTILILAFVAIVAIALAIAVPDLMQICEMKQDKTTTDRLVEYIQQHEPKGWLMSFFGEKIGVEYFGKSYYKNQVWGEGVWSFEGLPADVLQEVEKRTWDQ